MFATVSISAAFLMGLQLQDEEHVTADDLPILAVQHVASGLLIDEGLDAPDIAWREEYFRLTDRKYLCPGDENENLAAMREELILRLVDNMRQASPQTARIVAEQPKRTAEVLSAALLGSDIGRVSHYSEAERSAVCVDEEPTELAEAE